jgi:anti-sigma B factor antagonist
MDINVRASGEIVILDLAGNLTIGNAEETLRKRIEELVANDRKYMLINLANVPMIDSSGIGGLVKSFTHTKNNGGKLKLLKPTKLAQQLLSITGLLSVFEVFDDEAVALASF